MHVLRYIVKRMGQMVIVLIAVSILAFCLMRAAPGNPARIYLPDEASEEAVRNMEIELGLDKPLITQYFIYMRGVVTGNLGISITYKVPVLSIILDRLPTTLKLTFWTVFVSLIISVPFGIIAGVNQGKAIDLGTMTFALIGQAMPNVWLGVLVIYVFSVTLQWLPALGMGGVQHLILPAVTLGYPVAAQVTRMGRSGMIDVLREDYIIAIRAKGIPNSLIYTKYAFKNALIPIITILGLHIGTFLAGAVVVETIFAWSGLGQLMRASVGTRDYVMVQSLLLVSAAFFVIVNLAVDIVNSLIDPRITLE